MTTIAYYDVYAFAPVPREIHRFLVGHRASRVEVEHALSRSPVLSDLLGTRDGCYFLRGKDHLAARRFRFSRHSEVLWPRARKIARMVEKSGVAVCGMVTGSLAADNADEHADIDFLFVYPPERTWTSYASMRLIAKVPFFNLHDLCPNYVLSSDRLEVKPQNLFTAWEIAKAVPMFGHEAFEAFIRANAWVARYLPNAIPLLTAEAPGANGVVLDDPGWLRRMTQSDAFARLEAKEKKRKFDNDRKAVGVDMDRRAKTGSMDRHSPTRSFHALSELRYRMENLGLTEHPLFDELHRSTSMLEKEMTQWGAETIEKKTAAGGARGG